MRNTQAVEAGRRGLHAAALVGVVALGIAYGAIAPSGGPTLALRTVAAVQGGGPRGTSAEQVDPTSVTRAHLSALATVPKGTQLTVLPEDVVGLTRPLKGSWQNQALSSAAHELKTTLLAGVTTPGGPTTFHNFVVAYGPRGQVLGTVEKVHRVPFGEYVPARSLLSHVADLSGVPKDAIVGTRPEILTTPAGRLGVLISFEVFFSDRSGDAVAHGATLLVVPTNTTSYPTSQMPAQELAAARLQAVERGRDLVQASPTGYSAIINNKGTVIARSSLSAQRRAARHRGAPRRGHAVLEHRLVAHAGDRGRLPARRAAARDTARGSVAAPGSQATRRSLPVLSPTASPRLTPCDERPRSRRRAGYS